MNCGMDNYKEHLELHKVGLINLFDIIKLDLITQLNLRDRIVDLSNQFYTGKDLSIANAFAILNNNNDSSFMFIILLFLKNNNPTFILVRPTLFYHYIPIQYGIISLETLYDYEELRLIMAYNRDEQSFGPNSKVVQQLSKPLNLLTTKVFMEAYHKAHNEVFS